MTKRHEPHRADGVINCQIDFLAPTKLRSYTITSEDLWCVVNPCTNTTQSLMLTQRASIDQNNALRQHCRTRGVEIYIMCCHTLNTQK